MLLLVREERKRRTDAKVARLTPIQKEDCICTHILPMTMIDGKVVNTLTETKSCKTCSMCGVTPKLMNNLEVKQLPVTDLECGLSTLHFWIRIFEAILHIGYRLTVKKWKLLIRTKDL